MRFLVGRIKEIIFDEFILYLTLTAISCAIPKHSNNCLRYCSSALGFFNAYQVQFLSTSPKNRNEFVIILSLIGENNPYGKGNSTSHDCPCSHKCYIFAYWLCQDSFYEIFDFCQAKPDSTLDRTWQNFYKKSIVSVGCTQ